MDDFKRFAVDINDGIAQVRFTRQNKANALDAIAWFELKKIFTQLSDSGEIRCAILHSAGKHFCAGIDLGMFMSPELNIDQLERGRGGEKFRHFVTQLQECISAIEEARFPVVAVIQGGCMGAGLDIVTACDIRISTNDAWFQVTETQIGMTADVGTLQRIQSIVPSGIARELAYTANKLTADKALQYGLVNHINETHEQALQNGISIAEQIAQNSPMSVYGCKHILNYARDHGVEDALRYQTIWQAAHFHQTDMIEAISARGAGKEPDFAPLPPITRIIPES